MQIYVAAPYAARDHVQALFTQWRAAEPDNGWLMSTSSWINGTKEINPDPKLIDTAPEYADGAVRDMAVQDLRDVLLANALLLFTGQWCMERWGLALEQTMSGGRHVETGWALAHDMPVIVVGQAENIFHRGHCVVVPDFQTALERIKEY